MRTLTMDPMVYLLTFTNAVHPPMCFASIGAAMDHVAAHCAANPQWSCPTPSATLPAWCTPCLGGVATVTPYYLEGDIAHWFAPLRKGHAPAPPRPFVCLV